MERAMKKEKLYLVTWGISVYADNPLMAAARALGIQRDPESAATVFAVTHERGAVKTTVTLDLGGDK